MSEMHIINLDVVSYLSIFPEEALAKADKDKKYKHLQPCLDCRSHFTPLVFLLTVYQE